MASASSLSAEPLRLHGTAGAAKAVTGHQKREFGLGVTGLAAAEAPIIPEFGVQLELGVTYLSEGKAPEDPTLAPLGDGLGTTAGLGFRFSPFHTQNRGGDAGLAGLWLSAAGGAAQTGGETRMMVDSSIGYDFLFDGGRTGVGPAVGWVHIFQGNDQLRPDDANVLFVGVHVGLYPAERVPTDDDWDKDGILNAVDGCPREPEDKDGFEDSDGCPDEDNDDDQILDKVDNCPNDPEDRDGFEDEDGCPDTDNDRDKILDVRDKCPDDPEDMDGFEDEDGCPDDDNDKDGIPDVTDLCPNEPETKNNYADHDGCPDSEQIRVVGDKIVLDDRVHFRTNSAYIRVISHPLLERLAKLLTDHPEYVHIEVQGHTDARGPTWFNQKLSEDRARSVMDFLSSHSVDKDRLSSKGFGATMPRVDKKSEHAYFMNRRVEFKVTREVQQTHREGGTADGVTVAPGKPKPPADGAGDGKPPAEPKPKKDPK